MEFWVSMNRTTRNTTRKVWNRICTGPGALFRNLVRLEQLLQFVNTVLHQLDQKIIYPHYDFKHLTEKYFEIVMKLNDFSIQLVKYWNT